jgi:uncharacterized membrane protein
MTALLGLLRLGFALVALGLSGTAVAAWFGFAVPLFDLFNHFQVPLIAGMLVALIGVLVLFIGSSWQLLLSVVLLAGLAASALTVVPETVAELTPHAPLPGDGRPVIKLMTHNLFGLNYDMRRVARVIAAENPDIVATFKPSHIHCQFPMTKFSPTPMSGRSCRPASRYSTRIDCTGVSSTMYS